MAKAKHGLTGTPTWNAWYNMICRCHYPSQTVYRYYGGRGITVCEQWRGPSGFLEFLKDMGTMPAPRMSIDREDTNRNYEPSNCRWATQKQQSRNTRKTVRSADGSSVADLADAAGIPMSTVYQRMRVLGWSLEKALSTPKFHDGVRPMPERPCSRTRR